MPRKSPYDMHLSSEERLSLESMARKYTSPYCVVVRAKIILLAKVLTPNDFASLAELEQRLFAFQLHYERTASPFKWSFTRSDLHTLLTKLASKTLAPAA